MTDWAPQTPTYLPLLTYRTHSHLGLYCTTTALLLPLSHCHTPAHTSCSLDGSSRAPPPPPPSSAPSPPRPPTNALPPSATSHPTASQSSTPAKQHSEKKCERPKRHKKSKIVSRLLQLPLPQQPPTMPSQALLPPLHQQAMRVPPPCMAMLHWAHCQRMMQGPVVIRHNNRKARNIKAR